MKSILGMLVAILWMSAVVASPLVPVKIHHHWYVPYTADSFIFSPYKDVAISLNTNSDVISTDVNHFGQLQPLLGDSTYPSALLPGNNVITWAFATGECGSETWGGTPAIAITNVNIPLFVNKNIDYIIAAGGANGVFTCSSVDGMKKFVDRYRSNNLLGVDFDIENGYSQAQLDELMQVTAALQQQEPLRVSLTLATAAVVNNTINTLGQEALAAANKANLQYTVNLMAMDYGSTNTCQVDPKTKQCDMVASAEFAVKEFSRMYHIPLKRIELTLMLGDNDTANEIVTLNDAKQIADWAKANQLAALHYWSFDRDRGCASPPANASPTCNTVVRASMMYDQTLLTALGLS